MKGGSLEACKTPFTTHYELANDTMLATSGVGVAGYTRWTRAPSACPRAGLFFVATPR